MTILNAWTRIAKWAEGFLQNAVGTTEGTETKHVMDGISFCMVVSPELNARLEELARIDNTSKGEILRKAFILYEVAVNANACKNRVGILDDDRNLLAEIVGI